MKKNKNRILIFCGKIFIWLDEKFFSKRFYYKLLELTHKRHEVMINGEKRIFHLKKDRSY